MSGRDTDQGLPLSPRVDNHSGNEGGDAVDSGASLLDLVIPLLENLRLLIALPLLAGLLALGVTFVLKPVYTARTTFLPPQPQQQSPALSALASLGALGNLAGNAAGLRSPIDQFVSLMQSTSVADRIVDAFDLMSLYDKKFRYDAREQLSKNVRITAGRKDGLITVEVDDHDPQRSAAIANRYVDELRRVTSNLALTEAQQRRVFFEHQLKQTQEQLTRAQVALQQSGYSAGTLKAEPRAAAERYARLQAEVTAAEVRLQTIRTTLAEGAPEVQTQLRQLSVLRSELARVEAPTAVGNDANYIGKYRDFKYQETLFDLFARQFELARLDESREGTLIQVVDIAQPPERRSWPRRGLTAIVTTIASLVLLSGFLIVRHLLRRTAGAPGRADQLARVQNALARRR